MSERARERRGPCRGLPAEIDRSSTVPLVSILFESRTLVGAVFSCYACARLGASQACTLVKLDISCLCDEAAQRRNCRGKQLSQLKMASLGLPSAESASEGGLKVGAAACLVFKAFRPRSPTVISGTSFQLSKVQIKRTAVHWCTSWTQK